MATLVLLLAVLLAASSIVFSNAVMAALGYPDRISDVCSNIPLLCNNQYQLGIAAAVLGGLWVVMKLVSAARG
jgi:hypothetical protein